MLPEHLSLRTPSLILFVGVLWTKLKSAQIPLSHPCPKTQPAARWRQRILAKSVLVQDGWTGLPPAAEQWLWVRPSGARDSSGRWQPLHSQTSLWACRQEMKLHQLRMPFNLLKTTGAFLKAFLSGSFECQKDFLSQYKIRKLLT